MKGLTDILTSPTVVLVGWALLHFLWQGTAVAAALAGAMRLLRGRGANVRYAVACVALLVMLAMPPMTVWLTPVPAPVATVDPSPQAGVVAIEA